MEETLRINPLSIQIRLVGPSDNEALAAVIRSVLAEFGCTGPGWASGDPEMADLFTAYQQEGSEYWVVEEAISRKILGGGGFARLKGTRVEEGICELQKLYFYPQIRGQGLGSRLLAHLVAEATRQGYRDMYLETTTQMEQALQLYRRFGFTALPAHKGNTGHQHRCSVFMSRPLG